jgi:hypothetical protein
MTDLVTTDRGPSIQTATGIRFYLLDPKPEEISIEDIALSISKLCRYTGHTRRFYSVAQHCLQVSTLVPGELALEGLLHDATEAYIGDISKPLKDALELVAPGAIRGIEDRIHVAVAQRFGVDFPMDPRIKEADLISLATEKRDLMPFDPIPWKQMLQPHPDTIVPYTPWEAREAFMARYRELA